MPKLNEKETICTLPVYTNHSYQLQRVFKFRTEPIFNLYDTKEEIQEFGFDDGKDKKERKKKFADDE